MKNLVNETYKITFSDISNYLMNQIISSKNENVDEKLLLAFDELQNFNDEFAEKCTQSINKKYIENNNSFDLIEADILSIIHRYYCIQEIMHDKMQIYKKEYEFDAEMEKFMENGKLISISDNKNSNADLSASTEKLSIYGSTISDKNIIDAFKLKKHYHENKEKIEELKKEAQKRASVLDAFIKSGALQFGSLELSYKLDEKSGKVSSHQYYIKYDGKEYYEDYIINYFIKYKVEEEAENKIRK